MAAWRARALTEEAVKEIASQLERSPAVVESADVIGGAAPTGVRVRLAYRGDDTPICGNDILFWLKWHRVHGGRPKPPRIIIDGTPFPDLVQVELDFGHVSPPPTSELGGGLTGGGFGD
jgi:hypothetical protein